jgi:hypothetical protein
MITCWYSFPVVLDERLGGQDVTLGSGEPGVTTGLVADELTAACGAVVADVTESGS